MGQKVWGLSQEGTFCDAAEEKIASAQPAGSNPTPDSETVLAALAACQDAMCLVDTESDRVVHANPAAQRLFGLSERQWGLRCLSDLIGKAKGRASRQYGTWAFGRIRTTDDREVAVECGLFGSPSSTTAIAIIRPHRQEDSLTDGDRDPLTGLANRTILHRRLVGCIQRKTPDVAVAFLDLDHFKRINDTLGHVLGDQILRQTASRLVRELRPDDTVVRYGGDEFVVVLERIRQEASAVGAVQRVLDSLTAPMTIEEETLHVHASAGIVLDARRYGSPEQIIRAADRGMYLAKRMGSGHIVVTDPVPCSGTPDDTPRR